MAGRYDTAPDAGSYYVEINLTKLNDTISNIAFGGTYINSSPTGSILFLNSVSSSSTSYTLVWNPTTDLVTYQSYARSASATNVVYDVDITAVGWTFSSVTNGNPTSAGQISVDSSTATAVSTVKINKTANK